MKRDARADSAYSELAIWLWYTYSRDGRLPRDEETYNEYVFWLNTALLMVRAAVEHRAT